MNLGAPKPNRPAKKAELDDSLTQSERFIKAAQELGTDDDPERFVERVRKLAKAAPTAEAPAPKLGRRP